LGAIAVDPNRGFSLVEYKKRQRARFQAWINSRIPPAREVTLDQRRIFIFPSRIGFMFLLTILLMLVASINYQNNMGFALTFLLANIFVIAILHTFSNLSGLTLHAVRAAPVFAGQLSEFEIMVSRPREREHYALSFRWGGGAVQTVSLIEDSQVRVKLYLQTPQRGWFSPGRLGLESYYPLGLIRTWTWIDLDIHALVYPRPIASDILSGSQADHPDGNSVPVYGNDDFYGLREYVQGDSLKHVYWKSVAKGQPLQTKQYHAYADRSVWLDWEHFRGVPQELRLSYLCFWLLRLEAEGEEYGMRLPGFVAAPSRGEEHKGKLLRELALFGQEGTS
jgi:uncharacterized protein (DUF58 family)